MIYILIPQGWTFATKDVEGTLKDVLIEPTGEATIVVQDIIQEQLRTRKRHEPSRVINNKDTYHLDITIYFKKPIFMIKSLVKYEPNRNGKEPAITIKEMSRDDFRVSVSQARFGLWYHHEHLSAKDLEAAVAHAKEQRENRRHSGEADSPLAT